MAQLTNVWAYIGHGSEPKKVVAGEVLSGRIPRGSHFFCKYCWEDVSFVDPMYAVAHFKHKKNPGKTCIQKFSEGHYHPSVKRSTISLGAYVRIRPDSVKGSVHIEMCLPPVTEDMLRQFGQKRSKVRVSMGGKQIGVFLLSERLETKSACYLDLESNFSETYHLNTIDAPGSFRGWTSGLGPSLVNELVNAFDPEGMLFSGATGRRLPHEGHAVVGDEYYYVQRGYGGVSSMDVSCELLLSAGGGWRVFRVKATRYSENSVRQFGKMGAILSQRKESIVPLWPEHAQRGDLVCFDPDREPFVSCVVSGISQPDMIGDFAAESKLIESSDFCSQFPQPIVKDRQMTWDFGECEVEIAPGYTKNLSLWRSPLVDVADPSHVAISESGVKGQERQIAYGSYDEIPVRKELVFKPLNDGWLKVDGGSRVRKNYYLKAGKEFSLKVRRGMRISVYQGLDRIAVVEFPGRTESAAEMRSLSGAEKGILSADGAMVPFANAYGHILGRISGMPELAMIVRSDIKRGKLSYRSVALIRKKLLDEARS